MTLCWSVAVTVKLGASHVAFITKVHLSLVVKLVIESVVAPAELLAIVFMLELCPPH